METYLDVGYYIEEILDFSHLLIIQIMGNVFCVAGVKLMVFSPVFMRYLAHFYLFPLAKVFFILCLKDILYYASFSVFAGGGCLFSHVFHI